MPGRVVGVTSGKSLAGRRYGSWTTEARRRVGKRARVERVGQMTRTPVAWGALASWPADLELHALSIVRPVEFSKRSAQQFSAALVLPVGSSTIMSVR